MFYKCLCGNEIEKNELQRQRKEARYLAEIRLGTEVLFYTNLIWVRYIAYDQIANLYRSNISNGEYDYDFFHLDLDLHDGRKLHVGSVPRSAKTFMTIFEEVITYTRSRINVVGGY